MKEIAMGDDLKSYLDGLYAEAIRTSQRSPDLIAAALRVIDAKHRAEQELERAFGHLVPAAQAVPLEDRQALPHEPPVAGGGMRPAPRLYANGNGGNPQLDEALGR